MKEGTYYKKSSKKSETNYFGKKTSHGKKCEQERRGLKDLLGV